MYNTTQFDFIKYFSFYIVMFVLIFNDNYCVSCEFLVEPLYTSLFKFKKYTCFI